MIIYNQVKGNELNKKEVANRPKFYNLFNAQITLCVIDIFYYSHFLSKSQLQNPKLKTDTKIVCIANSKIIMRNVGIR